MNTLASPRFRVPDFRPKTPDSRLLPARHSGEEVLVGTGKVQLFGRAPGPWTIAWYETEASPRRRAMRSSHKKAKALFDRKVVELRNLATGLRELTPADGASFLRCLEIAAPTGQSIELLVSEAAEVRRILDGTATGAEAARFLVAHRPSDVSPRNIPDIITLLLDQKRQDGNGAKGLRTLAQQLRRFGAKFTGPPHLVRAPEYKAWEYSLKVGLRTRKNYRAAVATLFSFAKSIHSLSLTWDELALLDKIKLPATEALPWTPEQIVRLLSVCPAGLMPLVVLMAFGGVRHEEMNPEDRADARLDWSNIDLVTGQIRISKAVAKTQRARTFKLQPNLIAWLRQRARRSGPICDLKCTGDALYRLGKRAGIPWRKNACRESFISYRVAQSNNVALVAKEAGNSARIIAEEYLALKTQEQGEAWFAIFPRVEEDILRLPLFAYGASQK